VQFLKSVLAAALSPHSKLGTSEGLTFYLWEVAAWEIAYLEVAPW